MLTENMAPADDQTDSYTPRVSSLRWLGVALVTLVALLTTFSWWIAKESAEEHFRQLFAAQADSAVREVTLELQARVSAIERMARRWETAGGMPRNLWEADAAAYLHDLSGIQAIAMADSDSVVRWVVPHEGNQKLLGYRLNSNAIRAAALLRSQASKHTELSDPFEFVQGGKGVIIGRALEINGKTVGYISVAFRFIDFFDAINTRLARNGYIVSVYHDKHAVFEGAPLSSGQEISISRPLKINGEDLQLMLRMSAEAAQKEHSEAPLIMLLSGYSVAALIGVLMLLWIRTIEQKQVTHDAELRWRFALDGSELGIWDLNIKTNHAYFSPLWKKMLGYADQEISDTAEEWETRIHPDDKAESRATLEKHFRGEIPAYQADLRMRCKDGSYKWIQARGKVMAWDHDHKPLRILGTHADIQQRKQLEKELREGRELARSTLHALQQQKYAMDQHAIVSITDINGTITYANDNFCTISGYSREELIGQNHAIVNSGYHPHGFFKAMFSKISQGQVWHEEVCNRAKDGSLYWVDSTVVPYLGEDGKPEQYIAFRTDITRRKAAEINVRNSEEKFRSIFDHSNDGLMFLAGERFVDGNDRTLAMFELNSVEELQSLSPIDLSPEFQEDGQPSRDAANMQIEIAIANGSNQFEWLHRRKHGEVFPADVTLYAFELQGERVILANIRDISERKATERELELHREHLQELVKEQTEDLRHSKESAEQANRAKSEFLANMSHELRTPLHAILSFSELGINKVESASPDKIRGYFERVNTSGNRLLLLLNDLLDISKLEAGKVDLRIAPHDLHAIVNEATSEFDALIKSHQIQLEILPAEGDTTIEIDAFRIGQVVRNLLSNAIKFTPSGGTISISIARTEIRHGRRADDQGTDPALLLEISDSGVGIPENEFESIFDKFVQSSKTKTGAGGTGLGLSISREIADAHHGTLTARNNPEGGATFMLILPVSSQTSSQGQLNE